MKFLLKVILLVVNETIAQKKPTTVAEPNKSAGEYICRDLLEKSDFVTGLGVELRKIVTEDIIAIQKKTEIIDMGIRSVFAEVCDVPEGDRKEFFDSWARMNAEHFRKLQMEQKDMRRVITAFARICKQGKNLLKPQEFGQSIYHSERVKEAIKIVKDKTGYESDTEATAYGYTDVCEVVKLIVGSIEHVIMMVNQYPLRDFNDIKADAMVINELFAKTMSVSSELKSFLEKFSEDDVTFQKRDITLQNIRDPQLLHGFFGTPPLAINTKESEDISMLHMPFGRLGTRDVTRMNMSQSRLMQMSQRELLFSPKPDRSILAPPPKPVLFMKQVRQNKRQFQINSASLFASKDTQKVNVSRLESYSMVMPGSGHVLSSTVLDQTSPSMGVKHVRRSFSARKSTGADYPVISPLVETQKVAQQVNTSQNTPNHFLTPQPKRLSVNTILSPKIQLNDETVSSPSSLKTSTLVGSLPNSSSPSNRIKTCSGRPSSESLSASNADATLIGMTKRMLVLEKGNADESPGTVELFSKFTNLNISEEKENLFDISDAMLVNDSM